MRKCNQGGVSVSRFQASLKKSNTVATGRGSHSSVVRVRTGTADFLPTLSSPSQNRSASPQLGPRRSARGLHRRNIHLLFVPRQLLVEPQPVQSETVLRSTPLVPRMPALEHQFALPILL